MSASTAPQIQSKTASEVRTVAVSFVGKLDIGELLTGSPTVAEVTTTDLTIAAEAVSASALTILGETVAIGKAVTFRVSGGTAGTDYTIRVTVGTDASNTVITNVTLRVVSD